MQAASRGMRPKVSMVEDQRGSISIASSRQTRDTGSILKSMKKKKSNLKRFSGESDIDDISMLFGPPPKLEVTKKTALELDLEIQTERVLYILDSTIKKLEIAVSSSYNKYGDINFVVVLLKNKIVDSKYDLTSPVFLAMI